MCKKEWEVNDDSLFSSLGIRIGDISKLTPKDEEELKNLEESLNKGTIPEELKDAFNNRGISVSENAVKKGEGKWVTTDEKKEHTYEIKKEGKELKISEEPSFEQLIKKISDYAYDTRELDGRFEIKTWLENLLERELFLSITKKRHRDHLLHACRMALLGERILQGKIIYDYGKGFRLLDLVRELFRKQKDTQKLLKLYEVDTLNNEDLDKIILRVWFIAALFHDVGFIYEAFTEVWKNLKDIMKYPNFKEMHLDIEKALANFKKRFSVSDVREKLYESKFTREFDHSKIGACLISNLLGESNLICDMAAFITDHHSSNETLEFTERPLSFLMVLLDEIQEWQRPVLGRKLRDQILSEKISKLSPFIEYSDVKPELECISLSSDNDKDFEIKMKNGNLSLDFTLDYGDNIAVLEKTDFSFPLMLYLKYKDLQRLRIGDERKLKEALREALEVKPLFSTDSTGDIITELNKSVSEELKRLFIDNLPEQALEKPKVQVIYKDKEWEVVDRDKKYLVQRDNGKLIVNYDLPFNFSISLAFTSKGALSFEWHRQCDILLYETLEHKNNILSNWLDNIINYRTKGIIKFEIGNMPRVLSGDFKDVVERAHKTCLRYGNISREALNEEYTYEKFENDKIKVLAKVKTTLKNNNPEKIERFFSNFDEEIIDIKIKKALENGNDINIADIWQSPIPEKDYEKGEYEERFVMSIPFAEPLLYDEKNIDYEIEITLPASILERENYIDGFYNWSPYDTKSGKIKVNWDKELFDDKYCIGLLLCNCTYAELGIIQSRENMNRIINVWNDRSKLNREVDRIKKELKGKYEECKCGIYPEHPSEDTEGRHYYFERNFDKTEY